jgi:hypothetical protein
VAPYPLPQTPTPNPLRRENVGRVLRAKIIGNLWWHRLSSLCKRRLEPRGYKIMLPLDPKCRARLTLHKNGAD